MRAYHFVGDTLRDGRPTPADGEWLVHDGPVAICETGLHASEHPFDALQYAPGNTLCLVECEDEVERYDDKFVCRRRKIVKRIDATEVLRKFVRYCALSVIHLWDAPDVVRKYLETGDESLMAAARAASGSARSTSAWADASASAWAAASAAEWAAASAAAWAAASAAARAAAWADARAPAWNAERGAQKTEFARMVDEAFR